MAKAKKKPTKNKKPILKSTHSYLFPKERNRDQALTFLLFFIIANLVILALAAFVAHSSEYTSSRTVDKEIFLRNENNYRRFGVLELQSVGGGSSCPEGWEPWLKNVSTSGTASFCVCDKGKRGYALSEGIDRSGYNVEIGSGEKTNGKFDFVFLMIFEYFRVFNFYLIF